MPVTSRAKEAARHVVRGVLMGAADVVPGVSGGTVALLLGIYTRLIDTVRAGAGVAGRVAARQMERNCGIGSGTSTGGLPYRWWQASWSPSRLWHR